MFSRLYGGTDPEGIRYTLVRTAGAPRSAIRRCWLALAVSLAIAAACTSAPALEPTAIGSDDAAVQRAFERHADGVELTISGTVDRVLSDQNGPSGPHERFIVRLTNVRMTVLIEHNLSIAPRVPVAVGETVVVHGEYVWNAQGGLVHFTHHDPDRSHLGGYIMYGGKRYD
jgi:hypothetical protein